jgi:type II secretory ATPase GspE/PulE/Tfp pilus assembly ATPase PilB-like protein
VMTIEDPIEHELEGVNQIEVDPKGGLTFARGLRTILRSDPDVLLVGEVRDEETAQIAIRAAMTGHLVLTSLHVHNAAAAIVRLREMGVESGLLASSLNCIVAQRLVRRLCTACREEYVATAGAAFGELAGEQVTLCRPAGCVRCGNTGYDGRVALYEVMPVRGEVQDLIDDSVDAIFAAAVRQGMRTLGEDGRRLCLEGVCSVDEIARVTGERLL